MPNDFVSNTHLLIYIVNMHWVCASDTAAQETPEVDDFSAGINVSILSGACLYIRANIERGCDQKGTTSVLYSVRRKVLRGGRRSRSLSDHSHAVLLLKNFHEGPRAILQNILPTYLAVGHEMSLRVAALLASLFIFSALVVAQINAPNCNSTSWQWVRIL